MPRPREPADRGPRIAERDTIEGHACRHRRGRDRRPHRRYCAAAERVEVEIYERARGLTDVGAGISLWPNALKALYQLGMRPALDALSFVSADGGLRTASGAVLTRTAADELVAHLGLPVMVFHRAELMNVLVAAAGDIPIHRGHDCHSSGRTRAGPRSVSPTGHRLTPTPWSAPTDCGRSSATASGRPARCGIRATPPGGDCGFDTAGSWLESRWAAGSASAWSPQRQSRLLVRH